MLYLSLALLEFLPGDSQLFFSQLLITALTSKPLYTRLLVHLHGLGKSLRLPQTLKIFVVLRKPRHVPLPPFVGSPSLLCKLEAQGICLGFFRSQLATKLKEPALYLGQSLPAGGLLQSHF